jgi:hypothetical protein
MGIMVRSDGFAYVIEPDTSVTVTRNKQEISSRSAKVQNPFIGHPIA